MWKIFLKFLDNYLALSLVSSFFILMILMLDVSLFQILITVHAVFCWFFSILATAFQINLMKFLGSILSRCAEED